MNRLPFIDAHVHLWDLARLRYPWLTPPFADEGPNGDVSPIAHSYLLDDYLAESSVWEVVGMVHVEAGADPADAAAESAWLQEIADRRGMPNGFVAAVALNDPGIEALLDAHARHAGFRGVRHIVNWHPDQRRTYTPRDVTLDPAWARGFALLARYGASFDLQAYPHQFGRIAAIVARHPDIKVIVNHAGMGVDGDADWRAGMAALAALPNVAVKLSGLGFVWRAPDPEAMRRRILETIDLFGADRVMAASDFPTDRLFAGFDETLGRIDAAIADFTHDERRALFAGNANRIYRLGLELRS